MRTSIFVALGLLVLAGTAQAQPVRLADRAALQFNLGGIFTSAPSAFDGVGVGGRWSLDENMALRGAVGLNLSTVTTDTKSGGFSSDSEDKTDAYAIEGGVEVVLAKAKSAYLYTGGLLQLGYGSTDPDGDDNDGSTTSLTLAGMLGAGYFIMDGLTLGAEYRLGISSVTETQERGNNSETERSTLVIGVGTVGFHLGFWF
ncbi:MAG: outer membrane beta-barrel protein [bacterium]